MTNVISKDAVPSLDYLSSAFRSPAYDARISHIRYEYFFPISGKEFLANASNPKPKKPDFFCSFVKNFLNSRNKKTPHHFAGPYHLTMVIMSATLKD